MEKSKRLSIVDNGRDRITNLPEAVIHHILSFLDMKCVVRTSVLSKRWRYVWRAVSNLVFRAAAFGRPGDEQLKKFRKFVDNVLMLRDPCDMHKFHLHCGDYWISRTEKIVKQNLNTWILAALKCNVQDLSICVGSQQDVCDLGFRFPHSLFNSQSLSKLVLDMTLNYESQVILPKSMDLPRLRYMSLCSFCFKEGDSISKLIYSCPILESLILRDIWINDHIDVNIESLSLKHLEINNDKWHIWGHYNMGKIIKLSTPNLTSFICKDYMLQEYCLGNMSSLVTADIHIDKEYRRRDYRRGYSEISEDEKKILYPKRMVEFIRAFHKVKELTISSPGIFQVLAEAPDLIEGRCPQLCSLKCLKLKLWLTRRCLLAISYLLKTCPCLESLYLTSQEKPNIHPQHHYFRFEKDDGEVELSVSCTLSHLKRIEVREVKGCDTEVKLLGLLLMKATVLEQMVLSFDTSSSQDTAGSPDRLKLVEEFSEKLRTLPRASPNVTLIFL